MVVGVGKKDEKNTEEGRTWDFVPHETQGVKEEVR